MSSEAVITETLPNSASVVHATADDAGGRIDRFLQGRLPDISRTRLQALIKAGHVTENGKAIGEPGHKVKPGAAYVVTVPPPEPAVPQAESIPLNVVFEDASILVLDKPAGLVVHPGAGHAEGTLVNALIAHCGDSLAGIGGVKRPGIVHRLDKDTSGLLVIAKTDAAHKSLSEQFAAHGSDGRMERAYLAVVWGEPAPRSGRIATQIGRKSTNRTRMAVVTGEQGRAAATHYELLETAAGPGNKPLASLVRCVLETGRTHQIRVHMAHIGHPLLGDASYGTGFAASKSRLDKPQLAALEGLNRQALHATLLGFEHPRTGRPLQFESPLPSDIAALWDALRVV
jgi:23S rRNA pseudouridine1911/1915/1917 synthase